jgi:hypothetical protein
LKSISGQQPAIAPFGAIRGGKILQRSEPLSKTGGELKGAWSAGPGKCGKARSLSFVRSRNETFYRKHKGGVNEMKKRKIVACFLMLLMLIATFAACAATRTHESTGEYVDDSVITTKVKSLLAEDDFLKSFKISVESFKGTVQLSGFVDSQRAVDKAVDITKSVKGVKSVKNDLIVK